MIYDFRFVLSPLCTAAAAQQFTYRNKYSFILSQGFHSARHPKEVCLRLTDSASISDEESLSSSTYLFQFESYLLVFNFASVF